MTRVPFIRHLATAACITAVVFCAAPRPGTARQPEPATASSLRWIAAARSHTPGVVDKPLEEIAGWDARLFESVRRNLARALAEAIPQPAMRNEVVRRGILLHTDIALLAPERAATFTRFPEPRPRGHSGELRAPQPSGAGSVALGVDGQYVTSIEITAHWMFARMLVKAIRPDPSRDSFVGDWYRATIALFERDYRLGLAAPHLDGAREVLPRDPWILFYSGAMHEALASSRYQNIARSAPSLPWQEQPFGSAREELERAKKDFRDAIAADPGFAEAHLRLGRVLGLLGRHTEGLLEAQRALASTEDAFVQYFGALFAGAELEALGRREQARRSYERAAALCPTAQAPLMALSELARRFGDRRAALVAIDRLAALPADPDERVDPWWHYLRSHARNADRLLESLYGPYRRGDSR